MLNCAIIMGRLTADPELRASTSGISVTSFTVAVDRNFVRQGEERQADFINVVAWRQTAAFVTKYFHKGEMIAVQGSLQSRSYEDKNGNKRYITEIIADNVSFCGSKAKGNTADTTPSASVPPANSSSTSGGFSILPTDETDNPFPFTEDDPYAPL